MDTEHHYKSKTAKKRTHKKRTDKHQKENKTANTATNKVTAKFNAKLKTLRLALAENYAEQKRLMTELQTLLDISGTKLRKKTDSSVNSLSKIIGFTEPEPIPPALRNLLHIKELVLPKSTVSRLLFAWLKEHKMVNKKEIILDKETAKLLGMKKAENIDFYHFQSWLREIYE